MSKNRMSPLFSAAYLSIHSGRAGRVTSSIACTGFADAAVVAVADSSAAVAVAGAIVSETIEVAGPGGVVAASARHAAAIALKSVSG